MTLDHTSLEKRLLDFDTQLSVGLTRCNKAKDATELHDLEVLEAGDLHHFKIPLNLPLWGSARAERARTRDTYRSPLLVVKETFKGSPRAVAAVANRDLAFTNSLFGAAFPFKHLASAYLLAAILSSSFATWYFLMSSSEFGIKIERLTRHDFSQLPIPDLRQAVLSDAGKRLLQIEKTLQLQAATDEDWHALDEAIFDLYSLDDAERVVVRDGLLRASWRWQAGREKSVASADIHTDIARYAQVFMNVISGWLSARNKRHMSAEIFDLPTSSALRVVRFVLEDGSGDARAEILKPEGELNDILDRIGKRLKVKLATALCGERELRIHGRNEVVIIKPAARRYWMGISALEDADTVVAESFTGGNA